MKLQESNKRQCHFEFCCLFKGNTNEDREWSRQIMEKVGDFLKHDRYW